MKHGLRTPFLLCTAFALAGCTGDLGDPPNPPAMQADGKQCVGIHPGDAPLRRLTHTEYNNTLRDLLGDTTQPANGFTPEEVSLGFDNQATVLTVSSLLAEQYLEAAESIATRATRNMKTLMPCDPSAASEDACAKTFINDLTTRAFRRPPDEATLARLQSLYSSTKKTYDFETAIQLVIEAVLQSPQFLYRVEFGMPNPVAPGVVELDDYEMASRLSYLLWNSMPDEELFAAAGAKQLRTAEQIGAQATRMLEDPRAHDAVANFHQQWLVLSVLEGLTKDTSVYPQFKTSLLPLWQQETLSFLDYVVFDGDGDLSEMLTASYSMMNADVAKFYGLKNGPTGASFEKVELNPKERAGFLTQASILGGNGKPGGSDPVHRGKLVREQLLCQPMPSPPPNVPPLPGHIPKGVTTRELYEDHASSKFCSSCHQLMDPIGLGFEHYDGVGAWRSTDQGKPVDAKGDLIDTNDIDGPFDGAVQLAQKLAESDQVRQCVVTEWFRFGFGRDQTPDDACSVSQIQGAFKASGYNIKALLVALTQADAFRYRSVVKPGD